MEQQELAGHSDFVRVLGWIILDMDHDALTEVTAGKASPQIVDDPRRSRSSQFESWKPRVSSTKRIDPRAATSRNVAAILLSRAMMGIVDEYFTAIAKETGSGLSNCRQAPKSPSSSSHRLQIGQHKDINALLRYFADVAGEMLELILYYRPSNYI